MRYALILAALILGAASCKDTPTSPTLPATFTLAPGGSAIAEEARLTFVRLLSDSRCPIDVVCVAAGEATILIRVSAAGLDGEYELSLFDSTKHSVNHRGYVFTFATLAPPRDTRNQPNAGDYRATIDVTK